MTLVLDSLVKRFGAITALDGISFEVQPGEVFGFLGANGAGKARLYRSGVLMSGQPPTPRTLWRALRAG